MLFTPGFSAAAVGLAGALLVFASVMGLAGSAGGLVGNQGGIRSAAMLGFDVPKEEFPATATAIGLMVDAARMPVYLAAEPRAFASFWPLIALGSAGTLIGTLAGKRALERLPERLYRRAVSCAILALGLAMLAGVGR